MRKEKVSEKPHQRSTDSGRAARRSNRRVGPATKRFITTKPRVPSMFGGLL